MSFIIEEDVDQNSTLYEAFYNKYYPGWTEEFEKYKDEMKNVSKIIGRVEKRTGSYYPPKNTIFKCFEDTPLDKVKVVIWTEQPYSLHRSMNNIYKELKNEYPDFKLSSENNFKELSKEGILFMNACMCYSSIFEPTAYKHLWFRFTNIVIEILNEKVQNCIHLIWGKNCEKLIDNIKSREVYTSSDPSSYTFYGNNHFIKTNITLKRQNKEEIKWF